MQGEILSSAGGGNTIMIIGIFCHLWPEAVTALRAIGECAVFPDPNDSGRDGILAKCDVVVVRSPVRLSAEALRAAPRLRLVVRAGMGLDGIDVDEASRLGIRIVAVSLSADAVAEHAMALLLALTRDIVRLDRSLREDRWEKHSAWPPGLTGRTLGIVGFGRIGRRLAELAKAFRMTVIAHDRSPERPVKQDAAIRLGLEFMSLDELAARADGVCATLPLDAGTRGMLDRRWIAGLKQGAYFLNIGRGGVVDEDSLLAALDSGSLSGVALDVFATEPPVGHPLLRSDRFLGTPHVAAQTEAAQAEIGRTVVRVIEAFAAGRDPVVDGTVGIT